MRTISTAALILCLSVGTASAECSAADGAKWTAAGAAAGVTVALIWGGALIAAPFTAGGSLVVAAGSAGGVTLGQLQQL